MICSGRPTRRPSVWTSLSVMPHASARCAINAGDGASPRSVSSTASVLDAVRDQALALAADQVQPLPRLRELDARGPGHPATRHLPQAPVGRVELAGVHRHRRPLPQGEVGDGPSPGIRGVLRLQPRLLQRVQRARRHDAGRDRPQDSPATTRQGESVCALRAAVDKNRRRIVHDCSPTGRAGGGNAVRCQCEVRLRATRFGATTFAFGLPTVAHARWQA